MYLRFWLLAKTLIKLFFVLIALLYMNYKNIFYVVLFIKINWAYVSVYLYQGPGSLETPSLLFRLDPSSSTARSTTRPSFYSHLPRSLLLLSSLSASLIRFALLALCPRRREIMVFYFKSRPESGGYTIFMGLDKHENEELIKYGFPEDIW